MRARSVIKQAKHSVARAVSEAKLHQDTGADCLYKLVKGATQANLLTLPSDPVPSQRRSAFMDCVEICKIICVLGTCRTRRVFTNLDDTECCNYSSRKKHTIYRRARLQS
jgi:hypothetical protein